MRRQFKLGFWGRWRAWWKAWTTPVPLGLRGERWAEKFLRQKGYVIIATHQRDRRLGEIDIIAVDQRTVVFVEVKTRTSHDKGLPAEAVDSHKQKRITKLALRYLKRHDLLENRARFDIIALTWPENAPTPEVEHLQGAFEPQGVEGFFS
jgi:putative endonuclease